MSSKILRKARADRNLREAGIEDLGLGAARVISVRADQYWLHDDTDTYVLVRIVMGSATIMVRLWTGNLLDERTLWLVSLALDPEKASAAISSFAHSQMGRATSEAKAAAVRLNGTLGGRPRKTES